MKKFFSKKIALLGLYLALALIMSLLENLLPPVIPVFPYAKLGIANVILLVCFLTTGVWEGYTVLLLKCVLAAIFAGNISALIWALPSSFVAYTVMIILAKTKIFSVTGLSVAGSMLYNCTQILIATFTVSKSVFVYLPYMLLAGGLAGLATGIVCQLLLPKITKFQTTTEISEQD